MILSLIFFSTAASLWIDLHYQSKNTPNTDLFTVWSLNSINKVRGDLFVSFQLRVA